MATILHYIWQWQGKLPSEIMKLDPGERAFLIASTIKALEDGVHMIQGKLEGGEN